MGCGRMSCHDVGQVPELPCSEKVRKSWCFVRNEGVLGIAMNEHGNIFRLLTTNTHIYIYIIYIYIYYIHIMICIYHIRIHIYIGLRPYSHPHEVSFHWYFFFCTLVFSPENGVMASCLLSC